MNNNLLECVAALKDVRRSMQNDADPRIMATLSAAIAKLECCAASESPSEPEAAAVGLEALAAINEVLIFLNVVAELVHHFRA